MTDNQDDEIHRALTEDLSQYVHPAVRYPATSTEMGHNSGGVNPKDAIGRTKPGIWALPPTALLYMGAVMEDGAAEYGLFNWRDSPVDISIYFDALFRHMCWFRDGELLDAKSGLPHMAHIAANAAIILDAMESGNYHINMGSPGPLARAIEKLMDRKRERS